MLLIWGVRNAKYFSAQDWTTQISLNRLTNSPFRRTQFCELWCPASDATALEIDLICPSSGKSDSVWPSGRCNLVLGVPAATESEGVALDEI